MSNLSFNGNTREMVEPGSRRQRRRRRAAAATSSSRRLRWPATASSSRGWTRETTCASAERSRIRPQIRTSTTTSLPARPRCADDRPTSLRPRHLPARRRRSERRSRYPRYFSGIFLDAEGQPTTPRALERNKVNPRMFQSGKVPFHGDYTSAAAVRFVPRDPVAFPGEWVSSAGAANVQPVFHLAWTDNRLVRGDVSAGLADAHRHDLYAAAHLLADVKPIRRHREARAVRRLRARATRVCSRRASRRRSCC